jgi:hypothetical protein
LSSEDSQNCDLFLFDHTPLSAFSSLALHGATHCFDPSTPLRCSGTSGSRVDFHSWSLPACIQSQLGLEFISEGSLRWGDSWYARRLEAIRCILIKKLDLKEIDRKTIVMALKRSTKFSCDWRRTIHNDWEPLKSDWDDRIATGVTPYWTKNLQSFVWFRSIREDKPLRRSDLWPLYVEFSRKMPGSRWQAVEAFWEAVGYRGLPIISLRISDFQFTLDPIY